MGQRASQRTSHLSRPAPTPRPAPPAHRSPSTRGALSRREIADVALELIEQHGVPSLTMRALAAALGCGTMTLYTHVRSREDLLAAVVERLIDEMDAEGTVGRARGGWQQAIAAAVGEYRRLAARYPRAFELLALSPDDAAPVAPHLARVQELVEEAGLAPADARLALSTVDAFATGYLVVWVRTRTDTRTGRSPAAEASATGLELFDRGVQTVIRGIEAQLG